MGFLRPSGSSVHMSSCQLYPNMEQPSHVPEYFQLTWHNWRRATQDSFQRLHNAGFAWWIQTGSRPFFSLSHCTRPNVTTYLFLKIVLSSLRQDLPFSYCVWYVCNHIVLCEVCPTEGIIWTRNHKIFTI